jgi:hypothetical protein
VRRRGKAYRVLNQLVCESSHPEPVTSCGRRYREASERVSVHYDRRRRVDCHLRMCRLVTASHRHYPRKRTATLSARRYESRRRNGDRRLSLPVATCLCFVVGNPFITIARDQETCAGSQSEDALSDIQSFNIHSIDTHACESEPCRRVQRLAELSKCRCSHRSFELEGGSYRALYYQMQTHLSNLSHATVTIPAWLRCSA